MRKEERQQLINELVEIKDSLLDSSKHGRVFENLARLNLCMKILKEDICPKYSRMADEVLETIQNYIVNDCTLGEVILATQNLIEELSKDDSVFETMRRGYEEVKTTITDAIPEEVKVACDGMASKVGEVTSDITKKVKENMPGYTEKLKGAPHRIEKQLKSKFRDWLLDDSEK